VAADGTGLSLHRIPEVSFGNDPMHWTAATPTPGDTSPLSVPPVITQQPAGQNVTPFSEVTLSVEATGSGPLQYFWRHNGGSLVSATEATLTLTNVQPSQAGDYQVIVLDASGAVGSEVAQLMVLDPPVIALQPEDVDAAAGDPVTFTVQAFSPLPMTFQWRKDGNPLPGSMESHLDLAGVQAADAGNYDVVIDNGQGTVTSASAQLTVATVDTDNDGLPDAYELAHGFDPNDPSDAAEDADDDRLTNYGEYVAGTNPRDPLSTLRLRASRETEGVRLRFDAIANRAYTLHARDSWADGAWQMLREIPALSSSSTEPHLVEITDEEALTLRERYYQLTTSGPVQR